MKEKENEGQRTTDLKSNDGIQVPDRLHKHLRHVEEGILEILLYRDGGTITALYEQLGGKSIPGPKAGPELRQTCVGYEQGNSTDAIVAAASF